MGSNAPPSLLEYLEIQLLDFFCKGKFIFSYVNHNFALTKNILLDEINKYLNFLIFLFILNFLVEICTLKIPLDSSLSLSLTPNPENKSFIIGT